MKIVVTTPFTEAQKERLKEQMPAAQYCFTVKKEVTAGSPLWQCGNLLITPHIAGEYHL